MPPAPSDVYIFKFIRFFGVVNRRQIKVLAFNNFLKLVTTALKGLPFFILTTTGRQRRFLATGIETFDIVLIIASTWRRASVKDVTGRWA